MKPVYTVCTKWMLFMLLIAGAAVASGAPVTTGAVPETGLRYWEWKSEGILFRLTQRLPDQTRAYFMARGFDADDANHIAERCVFQSMFKNIADAGDASVAIDLDRWRIHLGNEDHRLLTREKWKEELKKSTVSRAAAIALEWSLLPTRQDYAPGDYNWGMTSYGLEPGRVFDLKFSWKRNNQVFHGALKRVECAQDIHPEPDP